MLSVGIIAARPLVRAGIIQTVTAEQAWSVSVSAPDIDAFVADSRCAGSALVVADLSATPTVSDADLDGLRLLAARAYPVIAVVAGELSTTPDAVVDVTEVLVSDLDGPAEVRSVLAETYARINPGRSFCTSRLAPRELEVLMLIGAGHRNRDIAEQLHISLSTVKRRVESLMDKSGRRTRAGLATLASEVGAFRPETLTILDRHQIDRHVDDLAAASSS